MSTSIYPAFRLAKGADLFKIANSLRTLLTPLLVKEFMRIVTLHAVYNFDSEREEGQSFREYVQSLVNELHNSLVFDCITMDDEFLFNEAKQVRDYTVLFLHNNVRDEVYLKLSRAYNDDFLKAVLSIEGIEGDYSYSDASDSQLHDKGNPLTKEEWKDRGKAWDELGFSRSLVEVGLGVNFFDSFSTSTLLARWETYEEMFDELVTEEVKENRFRFLLMNEYCSLVSNKQTGNFDVLNFISSCFTKLAMSGGDLDSLPDSDTYKEELEAAISHAKECVEQYPMV